MIGNPEQLGPLLLVLAAYRCIEIASLGAEALPLTWRTAS